MSSFDNKFNFYGSNGSNADNRGNNSRTANTLARIAFNLYGSSTTPSNNSSNTSISPNRNTNSRPPFTKSLSYSSHRSIDYSDTKHLRYNANYEMAGFSILNNDLHNQIVLAGKNSLQVLNIDENIISHDLLEGSQSIKNKKLMGSILDVSCGFQSYNRFVAASTTTGSILIFDHQGKAKTDKLSYKLTNHTRAVNSISFSPLDPHLLASGSQDGAMKLWDLRSSSVKPTLTMLGNSDGVRSLKFSPFHNKKFVAIFDSGVIQKWDIRNNQQFEKKINAHTGPGLTVDWHPEWDYIVSGGRDKQIQLWNMSSTDQRQIPDHVIHTAFPISKVSFRPNHSNNINSAEIAASFLNNDLGVEVYSLRRKFIPLYHIQSHSAQITGLNFLNERYILTSSKDKSFIMDDLTNYPPRIVDLSLGSASWAPGGNFCFTNQSLENHIIEENNEQTPTAHNQPNSNNLFSTSPTYNTGLLMTTSASVNTFNDSTSPKPGISRASSQFVTPSLSRNHSSTGSSHSPGFYRTSSTVAQQLQNQSVINPIVAPVDLPVIKTTEVLKYLVDNYKFDSQGDLIEACDFNSQVAASVNNLRDSKTWKVIKESLIWESKLEQELIYNETYPSRLDNDSESLRSADINDNHLDSDKYNYSTSNSTAYGKSPSLSDLNDISSSLRHTHASPVSSYRMSNLKPSILKFDSDNNPITEEDEENDPDPNKTVTKDDLLKWKDTLLKPNNLEIDSIIVDKDGEEALDFVEGTIPIVKSRSKRSSMRLITDDISAVSISPSYSMGSLTSSTSQAFVKSKTLALPKTIIPQPSMLSELTRQLTNKERIDETIDNASHALLPPFTPRFLIEKVIDWNLQQGDIIMSSVLIILFNPKYKMYPKNSNILNEIIYGYLEWLQRMTFFIKFTEINQILIRDGMELEICRTSVTSSGVRHFCSSCNKLIVNEASKAKVQETINKKDIDTGESSLNKFVGSWFCELCSSWNRCIFCNEVVKGLTLVKLKCGHNGHFGCLKAWFLDQGMSECPGGCY